MDWLFTDSDDQIFADDEALRRASIARGGSRGGSGGPILPSGKKEAHEYDERKDKFFSALLILGSFALMILGSILYSADSGGVAALGFFMVVLGVLGSVIFIKSL